MYHYAENTTMKDDLVLKTNRKYTQIRVKKATKVKFVAFAAF